MAPTTEPATEQTKTVKLVPIEQVVEDHAIQIRVSIDAETVRDYEAVIIDQQNMVEVVGYRIQEPSEDGRPRYLLADGFHRLNAYRNLDKKVIPMEIRDGTRSEALEHALLANSRHGKSLSNADKRKAAEMAVRDSILGARKDAWIAKTLGVSVGFVNGIRRGLRPEDRKRQEPRVASKPEQESPAPKTATAHERKSDKEPEHEKRPTAAMVLRQLQEHLNLEVIDEVQVIKLFESPTGQYHWMKKIGKVMSLKIVSKQGDALLEVPAKIVQVNEEVLVLSTSVKNIAKPAEE